MAETAVYPHSNTGDISAITYTTMGLVGEAGEVANKVKKLLRGDPDATRAAVQEELGDVLWYVAALARELGVELPVLIARLEKKLQARKQAGTLKGGVR